MKFSWLYKSGNENLIIFFSGWGIEPSDMVFLKTENYDVVMLHSFTSNETPEIDTDNYERIIMIAFSFGVYFSGIIPLKIDESYAFNGTLKPIDNKYGIRDIIFRKTFKNLDETTYRQFIGNMFDNNRDTERFFKNRPNPRIGRLSQELVFINELSTRKQAEHKFDKVFISRGDRIVPHKNQLHFWADSKTDNIDSGHFPFYKFSSWDEIVEKCRK